MNNEPVAVFVPAPLRHDEWKRRFTLNWIDEEPTVITHLYSEVLVRQQQAEIEALKANREHDFGLGEASGFIKGHQANPYQSITDTKIEPTVVSYTHPAKEHFEDEPQAEELHEIMQSNASPVKELTLTEDEIDDVWAGCSTGESEFIDMHLFAEAILRKASEK